MELIDRNEAKRRIMESDLTNREKMACLTTIAFCEEVYVDTLQLKRKLNNADYYVHVHSTHDRKHIETIKIQRSDGSEIDVKNEKPALLRFIDIEDMKESLSWCLNCYPIKKSDIKWAKVKDGYEGAIALYS